MVPPELIGSPQMVVKFREDWTTGLQTLARSLRAGETQVRFHAVRNQAYGPSLDDL